MSQDFNIEVVTSKSSLPTLKVNDYYLHSKYDPKKKQNNLLIIILLKIKYTYYLGMVMVILQKLLKINVKKTSICLL